MKTKFVLLFVLALFVQVTSAQTFGIKGGVNFANMSISPSEGTSPNSITGFHIGPVMELGISDNLFLNTGVLYSLKGYKTEDEWEGMVEKDVITFNNLEIPINLALKLSLGEKSKLFVQAGPYLSYALSGKVKSEWNGEEDTEEIDFDDWGINRVDFGVAFGAGIEFGRIVTSLNYQLGLTDMSDESGSDIEETAYTVKSKVFQISIAYMFGK
jgi:hypothetical protein